MSSQESLNITRSFTVGTGVVRGKVSPCVGIDRFGSSCVRECVEKSLSALLGFHPKPEWNLSLPYMVMLYQQYYSCNNKLAPHTLVIFTPTASFSSPLTSLHHVLFTCSMCFELDVFRVRGARSGTEGPYETSVARLLDSSPDPDRETRTPH